MSAPGNDVLHLAVIADVTGDDLHPTGLHVVGDEAVLAVRLVVGERRDVGAGVDEQVGQRAPDEPLGAGDDHAAVGPEGHGSPLSVRRSLRPARSIAHRATVAAAAPWSTQTRVVGHRLAALIVGEQVVEHRSERCGVELVVLDDHRTAGVGEGLGVVELMVPGSVRVRDHHAGHADVGDLADRAGAAPAHHHVGCRVGMVHAIDVRNGAGDRVAGGAGDGVVELAGAGLDQQHDVVAVLPLIGQIEGGGRQAVRTEAPTAEHDELLPRRAARTDWRAGSRSAARSISCHLRKQRHADGAHVGALGQVLAGALEGDRDVRRQPGDEGVGPPGHRVALVDQRRNPGQAARRPSPAPTDSRPCRRPRRCRGP